MADANGAYGVDPKFQQYYTEILANLNPQTIDYQAPSVDEIASQISAYLRPAVDQQIANRRLSTLQQRAATDADAASRGILSSTWVTDIKNRLMQSEAADVAAAESDYRSQLLQGVYNRQAAEADRANQIAMFNAQMRQQAEKDAYSRAGDMYNLYLQNKKSGGSGGSNSSNNPTGAGSTGGTKWSDEMEAAYQAWLRQGKLPVKTSGRAGWRSGSGGGTVNVALTR